eukprot:5362831-Prymnesium_polylepis.1
MEWCARDACARARVQLGLACRHARVLRARTARCELDALVVAVVERHKEGVQLLDHLRELGDELLPVRQRVRPLLLLSRREPHLPAARCECRRRCGHTRRCGAPTERRVKNGRRARHRPTLEARRGGQHVHVSS